MNAAESSARALLAFWRAAGVDMDEAEAVFATGASPHAATAPAAKPPLDRPPLREPAPPRIRRPATADAPVENARALAAAADSIPALRAAIEREQRRLLENKQQRSELGVLLREGESAQRAYDAIAQRATQTSLESQSTQASVQLLTAAVAPNRPVAPDPPLYMLLAALGGALLAVLAAFGREIADRRVRALEDLEVLLGLPMLAALRAPRGARRVTAWMARRGLPRPGMGRLAGPHSLKEVA